MTEQIKAIVRLEIEIRFNAEADSNSLSQVQREVISQMVIKKGKKWEDAENPASSSAT
jgi:hypothetical protein